MRIHSYEGCQTCIVQATCSSVCHSYKNTLKRKYGINVDGEPTLDQAETCVTQILIDCGNEEINLTPEIKIKFNKEFGCYIETGVQIK